MGAILPPVSENVERIKTVLGLFEREGAEGILPLADPDIEIYTDETLINTGTYRGHEGFLGWAAQWLEAWERFEMEPIDFIEVGDSIVIVPLHQVAQGKGSGLTVDMNVAYMFELRGGKVTRLHLYSTAERAVEAAEALAAEE